MLFRVTLIFTFALAFILSSCSPENSQVVLADFGNQKITLNQFEKAYANNVGGVEQAKKDSLSKLKNFLNLYVDFRMKLRDAYVRGFDQDSALQSELQDYKKKVGVTYIIENQIVDPAIHKLYDRRKWEYRVSHIMFRPDSGGWDHAHKMAEAILDSVEHGASFAKMAEEYSQDKFTAPDGGDLFYITAGQLPTQFEDAVYATQPGHIYPHVVKSPYGYHIIMVTGKRERTPEIRASHILASYFHNGKADTAWAKARIDTVMEKLKAGGNFAELAKEYSDDPGSKNQGGDLGFFQIRMMVKPFAEAAFNLKKVGDISGIVQTRYGFHIIKLTGIKPYPTFDEDKENLKKIFKRTSYNAEYDSLVAKLKREYNYKVNESTLGELIAKADTSKMGEPNAEVEGMKDKVIFTYTGGDCTVGELLSRAAKRFDFADAKLSPSVIRSAVDKIGAEVMLENDAMNLEKTDPEFAALMQNYKNGIYIFKLQEDEVWNKIKVDSTALQQYWEKTKDNYIMPDRVNFSEIYAQSDSAAKFYYSLLKQGANFDSLAAEYTARPGYKEKKGIWGWQTINSTVPAAEAWRLKKPGDFSKPFQNEDGYSIVSLIAKDSSRVKTFAEAKAEVSSAYQEAQSKQLENDYVNSLKKLYKPKIYYDELDKAFKSN